MNLSQCLTACVGYSACDIPTYNGTIVGTQQTLALYNTFPGNGAALIHDRGYKNYTRNAFNTVKYDINRARMMAATGYPFKPWLANHNFSADTRSNDYYQETALHAALMGAQDLLFFNPYCPACGPGGATPSADNILFSEILNELTDVVGCTRREWLYVTPARVIDPQNNSAVDNSTFGGDWDDEYFMTGMHLPDAKATVYRFTPNATASHPTPASYIVSGAQTTDTPFSNTTVTLVLQIPSPRPPGLVTLTFPSGKVYTPSSPVSNAGLWIVVPDSE